jgi:3-methylcrotonyl-CoA carboxylase alpha subunit
VSGRTLRRAYRVGGDTVEVDLRLEGDRLAGTVRGEAVEARVARVNADTVSVRMGGRVLRALVARRGDVAWVAVEGRVLEVGVAAAGREAPARESAEPYAVSPMTGVVATVAVRPGAEVGAGDPLFVVEAMKMEYVVKAPREAVVKEVRRRAGERVTLGEVVVTFAEGP